VLGEFEALKPQAKVEGQLPVILENCASSVKEKGTENREQETGNREQEITGWRPKGAV
jgi:hypothetical protein